MKGAIDMIGYEYDDGGREDAGFKGEVKDCVCRALSILTLDPYTLPGDNYMEWYKALADLHFKRKGKRTGRSGTDRRDMMIAFRMAGLEKIQRSVHKQCRTFSEAHSDFGDCIVTTTRHVCALRDGKLRDISDIRMYQWLDTETGLYDRRERKALTIWVPIESFEARMKERHSQ